MNKATQVLKECMEVQVKKAQDYQNAASTVQQADYYPNGCQTIYDTMHGKMLRIKSIQETIQNDPNFVPNHESLRDSVIDIINYASFYAAYLDNGIPGQDGTRDMFNKHIPSAIPRKSINSNGLHSPTAKKPNASDQAAPVVEHVCVEI